MHDVSHEITSARAGVSPLDDDSVDVGLVGFDDQKCGQIFHAEFPEEFATRLVIWADAAESDDARQCLRKSDCSWENA